MSLERRKELIKKIEAIRNSKVVTYVISDRQNLFGVMIAQDDVREIYEHLSNIPKGKKIDLFIYSMGGDTTVSWTLANLLRETTTKGYDVLIPFNSFSCATAIAIGANNIIMHKMGTLGPVDPAVANRFNPVVNNQVVQIDVEDVSGFLSFIRENFGIKEEKHRVEVKDREAVMHTFQLLSNNIHPLALGNVYRHYMKARDDTRKLLELSYDPEKDKETINNIINILVEKLYYHAHHINRNEAEKIGLRVEFAEKYKSKDESLDKLMWDLYLEYEKDLSMRSPYFDELPPTGNKRDIPLKFVESSQLSSSNVIEQTFVDRGFPIGTILTNQNGQNAIILPTNPNPSSVYFAATPTVLNGKIYEKHEIVVWKREQQSEQ